ncbi:hypothetical protein SCP_0211100 [Sparassis crispa]|uniref:NADH dehydrogenase [ubiquinone] 1 alpha subcomplex subunit 13 n=1 Tax=Sparassis crispa TaxID=139825 RepID=A0A401GCJ5_9APHY|nr:hypothetical protein SCP_0211100 [Sparassis crispa]GBE79908.1 hypothetical protein SCP_0211100 [Sparassis crispa]
MPPAGGFDAIKYKRNLPFRGPSGLVILGGVTAVCAYGFYRVGLGNTEKRCVESSDCRFWNALVRRTENVCSGGPLATERGSVWAEAREEGLIVHSLTRRIWLHEQDLLTYVYSLRRELQREKVWSRIYLVPLLLAEGDRDAYRRQQAALAREKEIMKDVKGWEAGKSVYNNPRYRPLESIVVL